MSPSLPDRPRRSSDAPADKSSQGAVVPPGVLLNPTALALWELCDGQTTIEEMVGAVSELFDLEPERARHDVEAALAGMLETGAIR